MKLISTFNIIGEIFEMTTLENSMKHLCLYGTKVFFILALFGFCALPAYAQENLWKELNDKTTALLQNKRYADAIKAGEEALKVAKNTFPSGNTCIADSMNLLGILYRTYGRYAEAEPLFNQALTIYKESLGSDHPSVAKVLYELAEIFLLQDKYAEAETFYKQSLGIYENVFGPDHPSVANVLNRL